jgi:hypothetical protein
MGFSIALLLLVACATAYTALAQECIANEAGA